MSVLQVPRHADKFSAMLVTDVAHISGFAATRQHPSLPSTIATSPRGRRTGRCVDPMRGGSSSSSEAIPNIKDRIDMAVFPSLPGWLSQALVAGEPWNTQKPS